MANRDLDDALMSNKIRIGAVGDISFHGRHREADYQHLFAKCIGVFKQLDLVVGNLESPLLIRGASVAGKCTLRSNPLWGRILKESGLAVLSLANNHIMDYGEDGLFSTIAALTEAGVSYAGAGGNTREANAPVFFCIGPRRVAFLARTSVIVSSPSYADENRPGVAWLDADETKRNIAFCKRVADIVILSLHWGIENYEYPTPEQRKLAAEFVRCGADLVIGHHPHVLQGLERVGKGVIAYSLGNFVFDDVQWVVASEEGLKTSVTLQLSERNRQGMIVKFSVDGNKVGEAIPLYTYIDAGGHIDIDHRGERADHFSAISYALSFKLYKCFWMTYSIAREWSLRIRPNLSIKRIVPKLFRLRPHHILGLISSLKKSARVTTGKTTNPYE